MFPVCLLPSRCVCAQGPKTGQPVCARLEDAITITSRSHSQRFICVYMCEPAGVYMQHECAGARGVKKRAWDPLELGLQEV